MNIPTVQKFPAKFLVAVVLAAAPTVNAQSDVNVLLDPATVAIEAERNAILYQHLELERAEAYEQQRRNTAESWRDFNAESQRMIDASTARREESIRQQQDRLDQIEQRYRNR